MSEVTMREVERDMQISRLRKENKRLRKKNRRLKAKLKALAESEERP